MLFITPNIANECMVNVNGNTIVINNKQNENLAFICSDGSITTCRETTIFNNPYKVIIKTAITQIDHIYIVIELNRDIYILNEEDYSTRELGKSLTED